MRACDGYVCVMCSVCVVSSGTEQSSLIDLAPILIAVYICVPRERVLYYDGYQGSSLDKQEIVAFDADIKGDSR